MLLSDWLFKDPKIIDPVVGMSTDIQRVPTDPDYKELRLSMFSRDDGTWNDGF